MNAVRRVLAVLFCLCLSAGAMARGVTITNGTASFEDAHLVISIQASIALNENVEEALDNGITLFFEAETRILRERRLWPDTQMLRATHRFALSRHALSNRYALTDLASGQSRTFKTLQEALLVLGDLQRVLVSDEAVLPPQDVYLARARLRLITEDLPAPMRPLVWISPSWWVSSPWYEWLIKR
jgi:hypothetical protein